MNTSNIQAGFVYTVEHLRDGVVIERETVHNLMPLAALNYVLSVLFKGTTPAAAWYLGLYEGNYTPVTSDTSANLPTDATETTAYTPATRPAFTAGTVAGGAVDNSAATAQFTATSAKTIYGGFMSTVATKGALTGTILSAVKFASPKTLAIGDILLVTAGITITST